MIAFILGLIAFVYLLHRIQLLETKISARKQLDPRVEVKKETVSENSSRVTVERATPPPVFVRAYEAPVKTIQAKSQVPPQPQPQSQPQALQTKSQSEFEFGSKAFTAVGVIALLLGIGFFLRYAFVNNLISQGTRVILGCLFGAVLIATGLYLRKKYAAYGSALFGTGLGVLYMSVYAGYYFYHIIGAPTDFLLLALISAGGIIGSLLLDSEPLVSFSLFGAYIISLLLPFSSSVHDFFLYLVLLNAVGLWITSVKRWPTLFSFNAIMTGLVLLKWLSTVYSTTEVISVSIYLAIIFSAQAVAVLRNILLQKTLEKNTSSNLYNVIDGIMLPAIPVIYILFNFIIFTIEWQRSLVMALVAALYIFSAFIIRQKDETGKVSASLLLIGAGALAAATAYHFNGSVLTYLLSIEALGLIILGFSLKAQRNRIAGMMLLIVSFFHMLLADLRLTQNTHAVINPRALIVLFMTGTFVVLYALYRNKNEEEVISSDERSAAKVIGLTGAWFIPVMWMTLELHQFVHTYTAASTSISWLLYALVTILLGLLLKELLLRTAAYILTTIGIIAGVVSYWSLILPHAFLLDVRVLVFGTAILTFVCISYLIHSFKEEITHEEYVLASVYLFSANFLALLTGALEISDYFNAQLLSESQPSIAATIENTKRIALTAFLLVYGSVSLVVGIVWRSYAARFIAFILFTLSVVKIFLYDTANLSDVYRFISFISLGVILLLAGFAYYRFKERIIDFVQVKE